MVRKPRNSLLKLRQTAIRGGPPPSYGSYGDGVDSALLRGITELRCNRILWHTLISISVNSQSKSSWTDSAKEYYIFSWIERIRGLNLNKLSAIGFKI